mmetsp:Transcript_20405/g.23422  ORF Transcript_20405/g.23422 Transcript_20405/m.23422 type:complete len:305 (+) Transcript_20405:116-1030(+)
MDVSHIPYRKAAAYVLSRIDGPCPVVGIICGSGLSGLSDEMTDTHTFKYGDIPGFPSQCTVAGHKGEMVVGMLSGVPTVCFRGRFHSYEGHDMNTVVLPVRLMRCIGVKLLMITNAAGGINSDYKVGDVVVIMDHLAIPLLAGNNPLVGPNDDEMGPRFPPTSNAYDNNLQQLVVDSAKSLGFEDFLRQNGTYCFVSGPMYESKAESRFLRNCGADVVGMSTAPEIIAGHHAGMKVMCISLVTNKVVVSGDEGPAASHQDVLESVQRRGKQILTLVAEIVRSSTNYLSSLPDLKQINLDVEECS